MNTNQRKRELYDKHLNIFQECNKLKENLNLALERSQNVISNALHISDTDLLKRYTKIYNYLNNLHLELIDVNCKLELYFQNPAADLYGHIENISDKLFNITNTKQLLLSNFLNKLEVVEENKSTDSPSFSKDVCSSDSLGCIKEKDITSKDHDKNLEGVQSNSNKTTSFKEIFDTKNSESSGFFLRELNSHESLKSETMIDKTKSSNEVSEASCKDNVEINTKSGTKKKRRRFKKSKAGTVNSEQVLKSASNIDEQDGEINAEKISLIPYVNDPKENDSCCMGFVESPSNFYIQLVCREAIYIEGYNEEIEKYVDNQPFYYSKLDAKLVFDEFCACFCEKNHMWYRAKILNWVIELDDEVLVQFVDFGNILMVSITNLRELPKNLLDIPIATFKCKLDGIEPPKGDKNWPKKSLHLFLETMKPTVDYEFNINFLEKIGDTFSIDLSTDDIPSVAALMVINGKARTVYQDCEMSKLNSKLLCDELSDTTTEPVEKVQLVDKKLENKIEFGDKMPKVEKLTEENLELMKQHEYLKNNLMKEQILYCQNSLDSDFNSDDIFYENALENLTMAVYNYEPVDEKRVCKFLNTKSGCWKGTSCKFSHEPLDPDGWTTDKVPTFYDAFNSIDLPPCGVTAKVKVKTIKDLMTFYVHIKSYPDKFNSYYQPVNSLKALLEMMNTDCEFKTYKAPIVIPAYGQLIVVKYSNKWVRGRVVNVDGIDDSTSLKVFLVDYGEVISVRMTDTSEIKEKFLHLPFQAVQCVLHNTCYKNDVPKDLIENGLNFLELTTLDKTLKAEIMYTFDDGIRVLLYDEDNQDVGEQLIHAGLLTRNMDDYLPQSNQNICRMKD